MNKPATAWSFGGPVPAPTRAQTLRAEGDRIMDLANHFREEEANAKREAHKLEILAISAWAKAETLEAMEAKPHE